DRHAGWRYFPEKTEIKPGTSAVDIFLRFALAAFQVGLAAMRGSDGAGAGLDLCLFREIAPAGVAVFRALAVLVLLHGGLGAVLAADNLDHAAGFISADVVADDGIGKIGFVARCQKGPRVASKQ